MRFGTSLYCQNYPDWDRFNAGQFGPGPSTPDHVKVLEDVQVGELADDLGFDRIGPSNTTSHPIPWCPA